MNKKETRRDDLRTTAWLAPNDENIAWLTREVKTSQTPGRSLRRIIKDKKTRRLALERVI